MTKEKPRRQVVVGTYENELDAEIAKGLLESGGIEAYLLKDDGGGMLPSLQPTAGVRLSVAEDRADEALAILRPDPLRSDYFTAT